MQNVFYSKFRVYLNSGLNLLSMIQTIIHDRMYCLG